MKPLANVDEFLKRFNHFKDGEFRSIEVISPTTMLVTLAGQDEARAYDWQSVKLEFQGITDARLIENTKCALIDMNDGISIIKDNNILAFGIGECYNVSSVKTSSCYIQATYIKYQDNSF